MKYLISLIVCLLTLYSCNKLKNVTFYENINESVNLPALNVGGGTDTFTTPDIPTNVEAQMKANNTSTNLVQSVSLQSMTLTITAPPGKTFASLQDIRVFILTDSVGQVEIANK